MSAADRRIIVTLGLFVAGAFLCLRAAAAGDLADVIILTIANTALAAAATIEAHR